MPLIEVSFSHEEEQLMKLFGDGKSHPPKAVKVALGCEEMTNGAMRICITNLRKKLSGYVITTETVRGHDYCLYRLVSLTELVKQMN